MDTEPGAMSAATLEVSRAYIERCLRGSTADLVTLERQGLEYLVQLQTV